jgi:hypothetical protein
LSRRWGERIRPVSPFSISQQPYLASSLLLSLSVEQIVSMAIGGKVLAEQLVVTLVVVVAVVEMVRAVLTDSVYNTNTNREK